MTGTKTHSRGQRTNLTLSDWLDATPADWMDRAVPGWRDRSYGDLMQTAPSRAGGTAATAT